jgi:polysaccharide biosynthesis/export protein
MRVIWLGVLLLSGVDFQALRAEESQTVVVQASSAYRIQPGDVVTASVWKEQSLQSELLVRPDGGISFPLAGEVNTSGMTLEGLRTELTERLKRFVPDPVVTVAIKALGGNRIFVIGKVNRPGGFDFSKPLDVMQACHLVRRFTAVWSRFSGA